MTIVEGKAEALRELGERAGTVKREMGRLDAEISALRAQREVLMEDLTQMAREVAESTEALVRQLMLEGEHR